MLCFEVYTTNNTIFLMGVTRMASDRETVSGLVNDLEFMAEWLTNNILGREMPIHWETMRELIAQVDRVSDVLNTIEEEAQE